MSKDGRLMLSNVQPLRCLVYRNRVWVNRKAKNQTNLISYQCFVCSHFSLMVEVNSINNLLLAILHNFPNGASNHVTGRKWSDGKAVPFPCRVKRKMRSIGICDKHKQAWPLSRPNRAATNSPFRLTIWEYFSCWILSKAQSTSSRVKSVKSSLLFRD